MKDVRELYGVVGREKASKEIVVTTAIQFSSAVKKEFKAQLELINFNLLNRLLNEYLGASWVQMIDFHCREVPQD